MRKIAIPKKVGAHKPTKIPNLSAWAFCSEPSPLLIFQIVIEPIMERRPNTKQIQDATIMSRSITSCSFSKLFHPSPFLIRGYCLGESGLVGKGFSVPRLMDRGSGARLHRTMVPAREWN